MSGPMDSAGRTMSKPKARGKQYRKSQLLAMLRESIEQLDVKDRIISRLETKMVLEADGSHAPTASSDPFAALHRDGLHLKSASGASPGPISMEMHSHDKGKQQSKKSEVKVNRRKTVVAVGVSSDALTLASGDPQQVNGPPSAAPYCSDSDEEDDRALSYWESRNLGERALVGLEELTESHEWGRQRLNRQLAICDRKYKEACAKESALSEARSEVTALRSQLFVERERGDRLERELRRQTKKVIRLEKSCRKYKKVAVRTIKERRKLVSTFVHCEEEAAACSMFLVQREALVASMETERLRQVEAETERRLLESDIEREQLKAKLGREVKRVKALLAVQQELATSVALTKEASPSLRSPSSGTRATVGVLSEAVTAGSNGVSSLHGNTEMHHSGGDREGKGVGVLDRGDRYLEELDALRLGNSPSSGTRRAVAVENNNVDVTLKGNKEYIDSALLAESSKALKMARDELEDKAYTRRFSSPSISSTASGDTRSRIQDGRVVAGTPVATGNHNHRNPAVVGDMASTAVKCGDIEKGPVLRLPESPQKTFDPPPPGLQLAGGALIKPSTSTAQGLLGAVSIGTNNISLPSSPSSAPMTAKAGDNNASKIFSSPGSCREEVGGMTLPSTPAPLSPLPSFTSKFSALSAVSPSAPSLPSVAGGSSSKETTAGLNSSVHKETSVVRESPTGSSNKDFSTLPSLAQTTSGAASVPLSSSSSAAFSPPLSSVSRGPTPYSRPSNGSVSLIKHRPADSSSVSDKSEAASAHRQSEAISTTVAWMPSSSSPRANVNQNSPNIPGAVSSSLVTGQHQTSPIAGNNHKSAALSAIDDQKSSPLNNQKSSVLYNQRKPLLANPKAPNVSGVPNHRSVSPTPYRNSPLARAEGPSSAASSSLSSNPRVSTSNVVRAPATTGSRIGTVRKSPTHTASPSLSAAHKKLPSVGSVYESSGGRSSASVNNSSVSAASRLGSARRDSSEALSRAGTVSPSFGTSSSSSAIPVKTSAQYHSTNFRDRKKVADFAPV